MKNYLLLGLCLLMGLYGYSQKNITGTVTLKSDNSTLPGASVLIKGTLNGVATDIDGKYSITVPGDSTVLIFNFIGMQVKEVLVGTSKTIDVAMVKGVNLQEVVIDALGFEKPRDESGAASSTLSGTSVTNSGDSRLINSMAGKTAGINIVQSTGDPGAGSKIQIRGATSITGDLEPLIVIDGVPMFNDSYFGEGFGGNGAGSSGSLGSGGGVTQQSRLNDINPNDIESMEILRGASAAALWGSRAANGVIVITTKKGKANGTEKTFSVDVSTSLSFDRINKKIDLNDTYGRGFYGQAAGGSSNSAFSWGDKISDRSGGTDAYITDPNAAGYAGYYETPGGERYYNYDGGTTTDVHGGKNSRETYDPYETLFQTGIMNETNVGVRAADQNGNIFFSIGDMKQNGIAKENSDYRRNTARLNITRYLGNKITANMNLGYTRTHSNRVQMGSNLSGLFLGGLRSAADFNDADYTGTYTDASGNVTQDVHRAYRNPLGANENSIYDNPMWMMNNILSESTNNRVIGKLEVTYDITDDMSFIARSGIDTYTDEREDFYPTLSSGSNNGGRFTKETITRTQFNTDFILKKNFVLNENIDGSALVGMNMNDRVLDDHGGTIRSFTNPDAPSNLTNASGGNSSLFDYMEQERTRGYYTSIDLAFYDQLFVNLTGRMDQLSTLPEDDNTIIYPAVNVAWQFSKLIKENKILSFGKLRVGYGQVGRGPSPYSLQRTFFAPTADNTGWGEGWGPGLNPGADLFGGGFAFSSVATNPELKAEIKTEFEIGTDLRFLKDRFYVNFTYYQNEVKDLLIQVDVPGSSGALSKFENAATLENKGIEIEIGGLVMEKGDFTWNAYANYTRNRNEVTDMSGVESILLSGFSGTSSRAVLGQPLGTLWGGKWARDASGAQVLDAFGFPTVAAENGVIGDPNPDFRMGIGSDFSYKKWTLGILFDMSIGGDMWNGTKGALTYFGRTDETVVETVLSADQANNLGVYSTTGGVRGTTVADNFAHLQNSDGTYTVRGQIENFGGGDVFLDESYYWSGPGSGFTGPDEQFIEDASWSRLREVSLSYDLTSDKLKEVAKIQAAKITFTGRNLLLFTDYTGNDPDQNLNGSGNNGFGLDYFQNPSTRTYQFTLNLTF
ncbi:MAG: SusC/RagA family TonB-linked outer membrane protein [Vicingaceae bacterium]